MAPGQPAQGCDKAAGQKEARVLLWGAASPTQGLCGLAVPAHPLGRIMSFSWGSAVQAALAKLSSPSAELRPGYGEVQPP